MGVSAMKKWTNTAICNEIKRQANWRCSTIERLSAEKNQVFRHNDRLAKRRSSYKAKNNGKGRPPKALLEWGREKRHLLARHKVEVQLLDELAAKLSGAPNALQMLEVELELERVATKNALQVLRLAKLVDLISQFTKVVLPLSSRLAWDSSLVRQYFKIMLRRQRARCRFFENVPTLSGAERIEEERERARMEFFDRVNSSNHLGSVRDFMRAKRVWRDDIPPAKPHSTTFWPTIWRQTVDGVWRETSQIFNLELRDPC